MVFLKILPRQIQSTMKTLVLLFFFGMCFSIYGQYFEGVIDFKTKVIDKETGLLIRVHTSTLYIGNGYYRYRVNTQHDFTFEQTRLKDDNKFYTQRATSPYITYEILKPFETECIPIEILKNRTEQVLNHPLFAGVRTYSSKRIDTLFFTDALRVNPADYESFYFGRMNEQLQQLDGRLPLKTITNQIDYDFITIREAVRIRHKKLRPRHFAFPKGINIAAGHTIVKNPSHIYYSLTQEQLDCYEKNTVFTKNYIGEAVVKKVRLKFIYTTQKQLKEIVVFRSDDPGLNDRAIEVLNTCKFDYYLGKINNQTVDTEIYQEIAFYFDAEEN